MTYPHQVMRPQTEARSRVNVISCRVREREKSEEELTHVCEVTEHSTSRLGSSRHEREEGESDSDKYRHVGQSPSVSLLEEGRSLTVDRETVKCSRRSVEIGGSGGPSRGEEGSVDD